jgi:hypothetical protein
MSAKHLMIAINWYGPYPDLNEARKHARHDYVHGLYLAIGKCKYERRRALQYIGIGNSMHTGLTSRHHKLSLILRERTLWLGEIVTAEPSGKRLKATRATLDFAEWLHARFLRLPLNDKKTKALPPRSVTVFNRWFATDYETPRPAAACRLAGPDRFSQLRPVGARGLVRQPPAHLSRAELSEAGAGIDDPSRYLGDFWCSSGSL